MRFVIVTPLTYHLPHRLSGFSTSNHRLFFAWAVGEKGNIKEYIEKNHRLYRLFIFLLYSYFFLYIYGYIWGIYMYIYPLLFFRRWAVRGPPVVRTCSGAFFRVFSSGAFSA